MKTIKEKIEQGYLFGCIENNGSYETYLMPVAYWILNYTKYDPKYNPNDWDHVFRDHIYIVTDNLIDNYIKAIHEYSVGINALRSVSFDDKRAFFEIYIDFNSKLFVSSFGYIELEDYLPDSNWTGKYENPFNHLPEQLKTDLELT